MLPAIEVPLFVVAFEEEEEEEVVVPPPPPEPEPEPEPVDEHAEKEEEEQADSAEWKPDWQILKKKSKADVNAFRDS